MTKKIEPYEDIPGTWVFDAERARQGYHLNAFLYSLMKAENRAEFLADERKYVEKFPMTEAQREAVRRVPEQIALDQHVRDVARDVVAHAGAHEERAREYRERPRAVALPVILRRARHRFPAAA